MNTYLTPIDKLMLQEGAQESAASSHDTDHAILDAAIAQVRQRNPNAFLTDDQLSTRRFVHEPRPFHHTTQTGIRNAGFVTPAPSKMHREWEASYPSKTNRKYD